MDDLGLKLFGKGGILFSVCAPERVSAVWSSEYHPGEMLSLEIGHPGTYCIVQFEDTMPEVLVYVAQRRIMFPIPLTEKPSHSPYSPKSFSGNCHIIRARLARPEELPQRRNLAFNPYDHTFYGSGPFGNGVDTGFFPHVTSNVPPSSLCFAPRTAIDGVLENGAHNFWPWQAWSDNQDPSAALTVDFGRPVSVDELRLTLRADFPHDSFWTDADVCFSDGTTEHLCLQKTAQTQSFPIRPRTVSSLTLCNLRKHPDDSLYTALTQLEAWGTEAAAAQGADCP